MRNDTLYKSESLTYESVEFGFPSNTQPQVYELSSVKNRYVYVFFKRLFDLILSVFAIIVLSPIFIVTAIAVKLESKGPVFYSQPRASKNGKTFKMYKFRSMCVDADEKLKDLKVLNEKDGPVFKIANDPRVTKVGRIIRRKSIDELPQLINIIKGDMSIVGPRPPLLNEVEQYTPYQMHRLDVISGLTCYWQISGRSNVGFNEWVNLDIKYIKESSLWVDFKIIIKTFTTVLFGWGAY
jgi:exopolysaccharide biosynthesis polyprenyl glycosylphosphotransferase